MRNIVSSLFLGLLIIYIPYKTNAQNKDRVFWRENISISWTDFLDTISAPGEHDAKIYTSIDYRYEEIDEFMQIDVFAFFDRDKSIKSTNIKLSSELLTHELFHFHITEFVARKLRKCIVNDLKDVSIDGLEAKIKELVNECWEYHTHLQDLYDKETEHSLNRCQQEKWQRNITDSLKLYNDYQNLQIRIPIIR